MGKHIPPMSSTTEWKIYSARHNGRPPSCPHWFDNYNDATPRYGPPLWLFDKLVSPLLSKLSFSVEQPGRCSVSRNALSADTFLSLFRASPGVIELELKSYDDPKLFDALVWETSDEASNYLPMLENIIIHVSTLGRLPYGSLPYMCMVKSRCPPRIEFTPSFNFSSERTVIDVPVHQD